MLILHGELGFVSSRKLSLATSRLGQCPSSLELQSCWFCGFVITLPQRMPVTCSFVSFPNLVVILLRAILFIHLFFT